MSPRQIKVLQSITDSQRGLSTAEVASMFRVKVKAAAHMLERMKPAIVSVRYILRDTRWVDAARAPAIMAQIKVERAARDAAIRAQINAEKRAARLARLDAPKAEAAARVASVWDWASHV